jgi:hypothetical protein
LRITSAKAECVIGIQGFAEDYRSMKRAPVIRIAIQGYFAAAVQAGLLTPSADLSYKRVRYVVEKILNARIILAAQSKRFSPTVHAPCSTP